MSTYSEPRFTESKAQPWKDILSSVDQTSLSDTLYGNCININAMERSWMQEEEGLAVHIDGSGIATSGAGASHSTQGSRIATSGAGRSHSDL
jgi:hypothetical protein